jgi:hypothetical protein
LQDGPEAKAGSADPTQSMNRCVERRFVSAVLENQWNQTILSRMSDAGLADWWLTAGCLAQTVWNMSAGRSVGEGIRDYDLIYYEDDPSWEAEDAVIQRIRGIFSDLPIEIEVRNQARVPIWYERKFGVPFGAVNKASDGIDRFPCATVAVGIRKAAEQYEIYAPFGLENLLSGLLVPNQALDIAEVYETKTARWMRQWPHLRAVCWQGVTRGHP